LLELKTRTAFIKRQQKMDDQLIMERHREQEKRRSKLQKIEHNVEQDRQDLDARSEELRTKETQLKSKQDQLSEMQNRVVGRLKELGLDTRTRVAGPDENPVEKEILLSLASTPLTLPTIPNADGSFEQSLAGFTPLLQPSEPSEPPQSEDGLS